MPALVQRDVVAAPVPVHVHTQSQEVPPRFQETPPGTGSPAVPWERATQLHPKPHAVPGGISVCWVLSEPTCSQAGTSSRTEVI